MSSFREDVLAGLSAAPKILPSKYLYDERGSELFEAITRLPEYYPTRVETELLKRIAPELAAAIPDGAALVEFGSGSSAKTTILLDAAPQAAVYAPIDISPDALGPAADRVRTRYPKLDVQPLVGDFTQPMSLTTELNGRARVGFFPGSTIGNFDERHAVAFLSEARSMLGEGGQLILGFDLVKEPVTLVAAYDDSRGVTAAFNLNLLARINRELEGDFRLDRFKHRAVWNSEASRMEMRIVSLDDVEATVSGERFAFTAGETIHTENSYKYTEGSLRRIAEAAGWTVEKTWVSPPPSFAVALLGA